MDPVIGSTFGGHQDPPRACGVVHLISARTCRLLRRRLLSARRAQRRMVLLGGDAGLRLGEILALEWSDIDLGARRLTVQWSEWLGHVTVPKGGRSRQLPMTQRLTAALKAARHLRSDRILSLPDGSPVTRDWVIKAVRGAQRLAGIGQGVHILRHTFCSHLAMTRGARAGDSGRRRTRRPVDDTAVHALESRGHRRGDPVARRARLWAWTCRRAWRYCGDAIGEVGN